MKSLDTNILLYAVNEDCREHSVCLDIVKKALKEKNKWLVADQVWFELYRLLRNPVVLEKPLSAQDASSIINWYRESSGWLQCAWDPEMMDELHGLWSLDNFTVRNTFDAVLALTLKNHGVKEFYTRNTKDFKRLGFFKVINPLDI